MIDDDDTFVSIEEEKADMEITQFRAYIDDIFTGRVWFPGIWATTRFPAIEAKSKLIFIKHELEKYAADIDKALNVLVWNA